jgi:hypothetical protein
MVRRVNNPKGQWSEGSIVVTNNKHVVEMFDSYLLHVVNMNQTFQLHVNYLLNLHV